MAILQNGLETLDLGATAWREVINSNLFKLKTADEVENPTYDINFQDGLQGIVLKDRDTSTSYRLYVSNGSLEIEAI